VAAERGERVVVIALRDGLHSAPVGHFGPLRIVRLKGQKRRGSLGKYVVEYMDFLLRAYRLMQSDPRFRHARVVHVHSLPDFLVAAALPAKRRGARVILDLHEILPEFTRTKFQGWLGEAGERMARHVERWSRRQADVTVTVNRAVASLLRSRPASHDERVSVVHNITSPDDFGPPQLTRAEGKPPWRLAYHGTLTPLYGLDLALEALALARRRGREFHYDIFGSGPHAAALRQVAAQLGLTEVVRFHGSVSHHVLREKLPAMDAGFLATRLDAMTRYSLSTKLLEYVHMGVPVIAPRIPTYLEYFPEQVFFYYRPDDADDAARALAAFAASSPAERISRARAAQEATRNLVWSGESRRLRQIYDELLARSEEKTD
jgi:glycosyltransferase involved in cell wall biosynthesis